MPYGGNYDVAGGGALIKGTGSSIAPVKIIGGFTDNSSNQPGSGGGVRAQGGVALTISGSTFAGNQGGGVVAQGSAADKVDLIVIGGAFSDNLGTGSR